jgi:hypothetical protein
MLSEEERKELLEVGASVVAKIENLIKGVSSSIQVVFRYGVTTTLDETETEKGFCTWILFLFTITNLGGSEEEQVKTFIRDSLSDLFEEPSMSKYNVQWAFELAN